MNPAEKVNPKCAFSKYIIAIEIPVSTACTANNNGAKNTKENSIGSVTPVKNEVNAIENNIPATAFLFSWNAFLYIILNGGFLYSCNWGKMWVMEEN